MSAFLSSCWAESLKARRSKVLLLTIVGFMLLPLVDGLLMFILKDPERARSMGLISMKAQLVAGVADWPTFFEVLLMGTAVAGAILFAFITAWVFGREFSDHTAKELLALPTPRETIVATKFVLVLIWMVGLSLMIFLVGLGVGIAVDIPGWSTELAWSSFWALVCIPVLSFMLMPFVAFFAGLGGGYLLPLAWAFLTMALAQIVTLLGWGDWFPWAVPGLLSAVVKPDAAPFEAHSIFVVILAFIVGMVATFAWWRMADQAR